MTPTRRSPPTDAASTVEATALRTAWNWWYAAILLAMAGPSTSNMMKFCTSQDKGAFPRLGQQRARQQRGAHRIAEQEGQQGGQHPFRQHDEGERQEHEGEVVNIRRFVKRPVIERNSSG
jgi:hypothetical protein